MKSCGNIYSRVRALGLALVMVAVVPQVNAFDLDIGIKIGDSHSEPVKSSPKKNGPPDHAPAHGYRAKHNYYYYPDSHVYFDTGRSVYFYLSDGAWKVSASLPGSLKVSLGSRVSIEMDSDKPYTKYSEHRSQFPPGHKKAKQAKANGKKNK